MIGWAAAGVVNGDHDAARRGPDAYGRGRAAVALRVGDCLGDADQQVVECGGGEAAAADLRERVPGIGGGPVDQLGKGRGVFERIGGVREAFECQGILISGVQDGASDKSAAAEQVSFAFQKCKETFYDSKGKAGPAISVNVGNTLKL